MRLRLLPLLAAGLVLPGCRVSVSRGPATAGTSASAAADTAAARRVFVENIASIHARDRARYLATYLQTDQLARNGPGGLELGFANWPARRDTTWPDTLVARDLRVVPVAPGVVYGSYHYRVTSGGVAQEGRSERVFVHTPDGWRIAVSTAFALPPGASPPPIALVGGTLVNPDEAPVADAVVVTRGGRIACAGTRAACPVPPEAEVVDVRGRFVSPGLIDAHVHFSQTAFVDGRPDALDLRSEYPWDSTQAALRARPEIFGKAYLCSGVTSVFDVGGFPWTIALAQRSRGALDLPRIAAAGPLLSTIDHWLNLPDMRQFVHMVSDSVARTTIREQAAFGADAIKVWYLQLPDSIQRRMRPVLMAAGAEARRVGKPLLVHATQLATAKDALEAGASVLVHSVETDTLDEAFLALARSKGTIVVPTLTVREGYADVFLARSPAARYPLDCVDAATRRKLETPIAEARRTRQAAFVRGGGWDRQRATMEHNLRLLARAGIPIAMGTDAGNPGTAHGPSVVREMEAMQAAGLSAAEVFRASTITAARAMGIEREAGSLAAGKRADIVVFDADPSAAASNARRVRWVVRNGSLYGRDELLPRAPR